MKILIWRCMYLGSIRDIFEKIEISLKRIKQGCVWLEKYGKEKYFPIP